MRNVMKTVDFAAQGIKFTYQHVPLPYHFYAFKIHQGRFDLNQLFTMYKKRPRLTLLRNLSTISSIIRINLARKF